MLKQLNFFILFISLMGLGLARADSLSASDALRQLIERHPTTTPTPPATAHAAAMPDVSSSALGRRQDQAKPNETLDLVIKRTWPGLPTKEIWVRKTFVDLNPQAFVQGNPNLMVAGTTLTIPGQADLRNSFSAAHPKIAALFSPPTIESTERKAPESDKAPAKWVRFP